MYFCRRGFNFLWVSQLTVAGRFFRWLLRCKTVSFCRKVLVTFPRSIGMFLFKVLWSSDTFFNPPSNSREGWGPRFEILLGIFVHIPTGMSPPSDLCWTHVNPWVRAPATRPPRVDSALSCVPHCTKDWNRSLELDYMKRKEDHYSWRIITVRINMGYFTYL